jgi:hypothetical protein
MRLLACLFALSTVSAFAAPVFNRDVRPILSDKCFGCHGFDANHRKAGLRLDEREGALVLNSKGRAAIRPGDLAGSLLWERITTDDPDEVMPPPESHKPLLTAAEKEILRAWILDGAPYQRHWSFEPPVQAALPTPGEGPRHAIDSFLAERLRREGLKSNPEADRRLLIRRLAFDLTGLPPTPEEVEAFVADRAPDAYEKVVEHYLASPHHGEHMARHWLDVARYGDTHGLHLDNERQMWLYRDWVVEAFNRNLPFDQFTVEQIAGDQLPEPTDEQRIATGFNRCLTTTAEGGSIEEEWLFRNAVDRATTTGQAWMGLTFGCAVCHDHKYDPIRAKDYYSLYAFFYSSADPALDGNKLLVEPVIKPATPAVQARRAELDAAVRAAEERHREAVAALSYQDPALASPPPEPGDFEEIWFDDAFPPGAKVSASPGKPTRWIGRTEGPVFSGERAVVRDDAGLAQDVIHGGFPPLVLPPNPRFAVQVYLDPQAPPRALMLQIHPVNKGGWEHRAVWGDLGAITWGKPGTASRHPAGPLPEPGRWVRLEVDAEALGLAPGDAVEGFALTKFDGTAYWDRGAIVGRSDPARDPLHSFSVWLAAQQGKSPPGADKDLVQVLRKEPARRSEAEQARLRDFYLGQVCVATRSTLAPLRREIEQARRARDEYEGSIPGTYVMGDRAQPRQAHVMLRGAYDKKGEPVEPGTPAFLPELRLPEGQTRARRLDLARWLVAPDHPLTARVAVNRFWQQFFGVGIVKTSEDFGSQGEPPVHPELLDWLAVDFRTQGWDVRRLVRALVSSEAYRRHSQATPEAWARDPENRLLARGPRFRLDAEQIRDQALAVSGLLNREMGGRGVRPYQPPNIWEAVGFVGGNSNTRVYQADTGPALYRRGLYVFLKRTAPHPFLANFDAPSREASCSRRERSNTPLQALQLLNDTQYVEAARAFAQRMMQEGGSTPATRLDFAFRVALARPPTAEEAALLREDFERHLARYGSDPESARRLAEVGEFRAHPDLPLDELAAYTLVGNLVLNLDESVSRN